MTVRRLFVIWENPLFHESARLLLQHPDISMIGTARNFTAARDEIVHLQPDTILFERTSEGLPVDALQILDEVTWDMRLIGFSLDQNEMSLYHRKNQLVVEAGDLLQFVLG